MIRRSFQDGVRIQYKTSPHQLQLHVNINRLQVTQTDLQSNSHPVYPQNNINFRRPSSLTFNTILTKRLIRLWTRSSISTCVFIKHLSEIKITENGMRKLQARNRILLKLMSNQLVEISITLFVFDWCNHISCVRPDQLWVNGKYNGL